MEPDRARLARIPRLRSGRLLCCGGRGKAGGDGDDDTLWRPFWLDWDGAGASGPTPVWHRDAIAEWCHSPAARVWGSLYQTRCDANGEEGVCSAGLRG